MESKPIDVVQQPSGPRFRGPLGHLVARYYDIKRKSSIQQLRDDFGCYPPLPLMCNGLTGKLEVVRIRGIGEVFYDLVKITRMLRALDGDSPALSPEFIEFYGTDDLLALHQTLSRLGPNSRLLRPFAITIMYAATVKRSIARLIRSRHHEDRGLGYFLPLRSDESSIVIKMARHAKTGADEMSTISHEHLHLLQFRDAEQHLRHARSPELLVTARDESMPHLRYLLEKKEVEARLHETVLCFYRRNGFLPLTHPTFLGLLAANEQFGDVIRAALECSEHDFEHFPPYPSRDRESDEQLESVLVFIHTPELMCRFIMEVLPIMYGNLIRYYGDHAASEKYLDSISRPNLYDELYGLNSS